MVDQLESFWDQILDITAVFVTPNWNDPIGWLPILLLVGVVGPLLTLVALFWLRYLVTRPRPRVAFADPRRPAPLSADGLPLFPSGEPYCPRDAIIYEPGPTTCDACGQDLLVICPKCNLVRAADVSTCGNCGLEFTLKPRARQLRPAGPPPGGAAAA